jgi:parvulin-like peptidyl-prolyl isomerase
MKPRLISIALLPAIVALGGAHGALAAEEQATVVAVVNGEPVLAENLERQLGRLHSSAQESQRSGFDLDRLMFRVVNDVLIGQEARALGMHEESSIRDQVDDRRRQLALGRIQQVEIGSKAEPTDEAVEATFEELYRSVTFRVVTVDDREEADELLRELRAGADIEALAAERSVDPYRRRGGLVNSIAQVDLGRDVAQLVFSLEPGAAGGPVQTDLGWSVVRAESFLAADPVRFASAESTVRSLLRQRKATELSNALARKLRERHPVAIDEDVVEAMVPERQSDGRLLPTIPPPDTIVATIGKEGRLSAEEYRQALLARWSGVRSEEAAVAAAPIILDRLIERELLLAEALARGYADDPSVTRAAHDYETQLIIPRYLEEVIGADVEVTEEEKRAYYEEHENEFRIPPRIRLSQITVGSREEAERIAELLREGTDVAWLAARSSTDRFKEIAGDRGWYTPKPGQEDFNAALLEAEVGEVLEPFGELDNWVVLLVTDREEQGVYPFEQVSGNVRSMVFSRNFTAALDDLIKKLRERSEIEIREDVLASLDIGAHREESADDGKQKSGHGH